MWHELAMRSELLRMREGGGREVQSGHPGPAMCRASVNWDTSGRVQSVEMMARGEEASQREPRVGAEEGI